MLFRSAQAGWKDVVFVPSQSTVRFIAKFEDYADAIHPFMFHCHISLHEDEGMMGQFVVTGTTGINEVKFNNGYSIYPNPAHDRIYLRSENGSPDIYYITVMDALGRTKLMLPKPELENGINISDFAPGIYSIRIIDNRTKTTSVVKFVKG